MPEDRWKGKERKERGQEARRKELGPAPIPSEQQRELVEGIWVNLLTILDSAKEIERRNDTVYLKIPDDEGNKAILRSLRYNLRKKGPDNPVQISGGMILVEAKTLYEKAGRIHKEGEIMEKLRKLGIEPSELEGGRTP